MFRSWKGSTGKNWDFVFFGGSRQFTLCILVIHQYLIFTSCGTRPLTTARAMRCEYYNETMCNSNNNGVGCSRIEECKPGENEKANLCYVLFQNRSSGFSIKLKGCWVGSHQGCGEKQCMEANKKEPKVQLQFCCCEGDMCNKQMSLPVAVFSSTPDAVRPSTAGPIRMVSGTDQVQNILLFTLLPFTILAVISVLGYWLYRRHKMAYFNELPTTEPSPLPPPSPLLGLRPVQLLEVKAQGRFGAVWKAQIRTELVAVKIFPPQDKNSWLVEQEIYKLPQMKNENILSFVGVERRGEGLLAEYWLITAYHERGSLCDFLKANLVSWGDVLSIADSIAKGLVHLHEEAPATKTESYKPAIAHRDFKSKNVLIKNNMTACIADFGLALVFLRGQPPGDAHGQVGTRRYMAPEVLEGAISFNRDAFLKIDMYACGLVLWELISRCSAVDGPVEEYMLPFEETVGQHPTLEDMQEVVSQKKFRPKFKDHWRKHVGIDSLCVTIEECWDQDAEARISASCVQERILSLYKSLPPSLGTPTNKVTDVICSTATSGNFPDILGRPNPSTPLFPKESSI